MGVLLTTEALIFKGEKMNKYKVGDKVVLKSGGPEMIIEGEQLFYVCSWEHNGVKCTANLTEPCIRPLDTQEELWNLQGLSKSE